jgi:hypothetical protein
VSELVLLTGVVYGDTLPVTLSMLQQLQGRFLLGSLGKGVLTTPRFTTV